jgi:hypothetical protein
VPPDREQLLDRLMKIKGGCSFIGVKPLPPLSMNWRLATSFREPRWQHGYNDYVVGSGRSWRAELPRCRFKDALDMGNIK